LPPTPTIVHTHTHPQLLARGPLIGNFDRFLRALLGAFDADTSKTRAALMKAVAGMVGAAPAIMLNPVRAVGGGAAAWVL